MSVMTNAEGALRLYEELNAGNLDVIDEVCAEDLAGHLLFYPWSISSRPQAQGSAFFKEVVRHGQETAAYRYTVEKTLSAADSVTVIVRLDGSRGGKAIVLYEMIVYRFLNGNREVRLTTTDQRQVENAASDSEKDWLDMEGLDYRDTVTDFELPAGTLFDFGVVHLLTTATLDRMRALYPQGRFEVRR